MFRKLFPVLMIVAFLFTLTANVTLAAPPAPRAEEQSQFNLVSNIKVQTATDGQQYAVAAAEGVYARLVVKYNASGEPAILFNGTELTGFMADAFVRGLTKGAYTLPYAMDPAIFTSVNKSGLESVQISVRGAKVMTFVDGEEVATINLKGVAHVGELIEQSEILSGTLPMGTFNAVKGGIDILTSLGLDEYDLAVLSANYGTKTTPITWATHRENAAIKLSGLVPSRVDTTAPAATEPAKQAAVQIKSGEGPSQVAQRMANTGYDYTECLNWLNNYRAKGNPWVAGRIIVLPDSLQPIDNSTYAFVGE